MSVCPSCRAPAQPGATHCMHCRAPLAAAGGWGPSGGAPQGGYGAPQGGGYGAPPAGGGYGAPPAGGGYGAPPAGGGYGAPPPPQGYGPPPGIPGPPLPAYGGPQAAPGGFGPQPFGAPGGMGPGMAPGPQIPAYGGGAQPAKAGGLGGCGIAAIIGAAVALLGGIGLVLLLVAVAADDDDDAPSRPVVSEPAPVAAPAPGPAPAPVTDDTLRDDIPDTGALRVLIKDRVGQYTLSGVGEITSLAPILQGGVVDSKAAQYRAPNGALVELFLVAYGSQAIAQGKILALEAALNAEKAPHERVTRSSVYNKARQIVGTRLRVQNSVPNEAVYWTNGRLLGFVRAPAPHAIAFEVVAPF